MIELIVRTRRYRVLLLEPPSFLTCQTKLSLFVIALTDGYVDGGIVAPQCGNDVGHARDRDLFRSESDNDIAAQVRSYL